MSPGQIILAPIVPVWLICILLCASVAGALIQYRLLLKRLPRTKALTLSLLRLGALALLISCALNPLVLTRKEHSVIPAIAVLVDTSQTMGLPGRDGMGSRLDEARAVLLSGPKPLVQSLGERFDVRFYALGNALKAAGAGDLPGLKAEGKGVSLSEALAQLVGKYAFAVFLSDGASKGEADKPPALPLITLPVGDQGAYKDIMIKSVKAPGLAFRGRLVAIDVTIGSYGFKDLTVPLLLKEGDRVLSATNARIREGHSDATLSLSFTPEEIGSHALTLSIPVQAGESVAANNRADLSVKVVRDKIRVLMVTGSPSLNYRFMRMALKNDPSVDLLSFVLLRTPSNIINVPVQEQSLIPFPVDTLFSKELHDFDLLIFDNLLSHLYLDPKHLEAIRDFVGAGGGFAMIGGPNFSDEKGLGLSPLGEILPVSVPEGEDYSRASPAGVKLTSAGMTHPVTRLLPDSASTVKVWQEMSPLDGLNIVKPKVSGKVLLQSSDGAARPVLTVGSFGKGRVLVLATDYSWKWHMGMVAQGKDNRTYPTFVARVVRWLTKDPDLDPMTLTLPDRRPEAGQEVEVRMTVRDDVARSSKEALLFSVFGPEGTKVGSRLRPTGQAGEFIGSFQADKGGAYRVRVETTAGRVEETIVVSEPMEGLDGVPDPGWLKTFSAATGGKLVSGKDDLLKEIASYSEKATNVFFQERHLPLWGKLPVVALLLAMLAAEWYLRRRWGLA